MFMYTGCYILVEKVPGLGSGPNKVRPQLPTMQSLVLSVIWRMKIWATDLGMHRIRTFGFEFGRNKCFFLAHKIFTLHRAYSNMSLIRTNIKTHAQTFSNQFVFFPYRLMTDSCRKSRSVTYPAIWRCHHIIRGRCGVSYGRCGCECEGCASLKEMIHLLREICSHL
jgi:hypothetical protein